MHRFVATCAPGLEKLLADELRELGLAEVEPGPRIVRFAGRLIDAYGACMWSRLAGRILLPLTSYGVRSAEDLYGGARRVRWLDHLGTDTTFAVRFVGTDAVVRNSLFGALKVKDGIVDHIRDHCGSRPNVDRHNPDVAINAHLGRGRVTLAIDLSGPPLHQRGFERDGGPAPLRETLAAAILRLAGWHQAAPQGATLLDPMCGSGTLLSEAAAIQLDQAPGLLRHKWGFQRWRGHDRRDWARVVARAKERARPAEMCRVIGSDRDPEQLDRARNNIVRARLDEAIRVRRCTLADLQAPSERGLLVTNPPYGERLEDQGAALATWAELGDVLRERFAGWDRFCLAGSREGVEALGIKPARQHALFNGPLETRLLELPRAN